MRRDAGLTLLEVIIATLILAVGVIGAAALQSTGLQASRTASIIQQLDADARSAVSELRVQYADYAGTEARTWDCGTGYDSACSYELRPCSYSAAGLDCSHGTVVEPVAYGITVRTSREDHEVVLSTIVMRWSP